MRTRLVIGGLTCVGLTFLATPGPSAMASPSPSPSPSSGTVVPGATSSVGSEEATATGRTVLGDGHVDIGARFAGGSWRIQARDDSVRPPVWRNLEDVVLHAVDASKVRVPSDRAFAFLGKPGAQLWVLPQVQREGMLWPGWNTQDPRVATTINREVTWRLNGVTGPGRFSLFVNGDFGAPQVMFDSAKPYPQQTGIELNTHAHGNWAFSAPGTYLLDIEMSAQTRDGGRQVADRRLLRVFVGGGDPGAAWGAAAPAGFVAGGPSSGAAPATTGAGSGGGLPLSGWLLIGGLGVVLLLAGAVTVPMLRRRA